MVKDESAAKLAENSTADYILLDAGYGTGQTFDWELLSDIKRPYFLAGGLDPDNVAHIQFLNITAIVLKTHLKIYSSSDSIFQPFPSTHLNCVHDSQLTLNRLCLCNRCTL